MSRTLNWAYYPGGQLRALADNGVPTGLYSQLVDNSDLNNALLHRDVGHARQPVRVHRFTTTPPTPRGPGRTPSPGT